MLNHSPKNVPAKRSRSLQIRLREEIRKIRIYSSHEHYCTEADYLKKRLDFFTLMAYVQYALFSSGMARDTIQQLSDPATPEDEKWRLFEPYRDAVANTEYFREIQIVLRDQFGIRDLTRKTYRQVGEALRRVQKPGRYRQVLDAAGIEYALVDHVYYHYQQFPTNPPFDPALFGQVWRDFWSRPQFYAENGAATVKEGLALIDRTMESLARQKTRAIKIACAAGGYPLSFRKWNARQVEKAFAIFLKNPKAPQEEIMPFCDTAVYRAVEGATRRGLLVQVHTGMQSYAAGNPYFLKNLIDAFPNTPFDLFHAGYPFSGELGVLAQWFNNVYGDLCWTAIISKALAKRILSEWLEMVPANKIIGFGSDHGFIENTYGYQVLARAIVTETLEEKILSGRFEEDQAVDLARRLLRDNLRELLEQQPTP